jgi:hypothetical protein
VGLRFNGQAHSDRAPDINGIGPISEDGDVAPFRDRHHFGTAPTTTAAPVSRSTAPKM